MSIEIIERFFFWSMIINGVIYIVSSLATMFLRGFLCYILKTVFDFDQKESLKSVQNYLAHYKLLITVFNFTPWIVILIIK